MSEPSKTRDTQITAKAERNLMHIDEPFRQQAVELLQSLVRIPSVNPPGNEDEIAAFVHDFFAAHAISSRSVPLATGRSSVVAEIKGSEPGRVVLCGHLDTVRIDEKLWTVSPFEASISKGKMYGRGTADMKSGVAAIMMMGAWLSARPQPPRKTVVLALTADEENGFRGAESLVQAGVFDDAELLIVTEPSGGRAYVGEKGSLWMEASFHGRAAHGSVPEMGASTILPAARYALAISEKIADLDAITGRGKTTVNIGEIRGGWQINIVAQQTTLKLDIRIVCQDHRDVIRDLSQRIGKRIAAQAGVRFTQHIMREKPPIISDPENPWVARFCESAERATGRVQGAQIVPYATDGAVIVPVVDAPLVVFGPGSIAQAHQPDEFVELTSFHEALAVLADFLQTTVCATNC
jgi:succinyl-diaminopimelate desuccinylase